MCPCFSVKGAAIAVVIFQLSGGGGGSKQWVCDVCVARSAVRLFSAVGILYCRGGRARLLPKAGVFPFRRDPRGSWTNQPYSQASLRLLNQQLSSRSEVAYLGRSCLLDWVVVVVFVLVHERGWWVFSARGGVICTLHWLGAVGRRAGRAGIFVI